MRGYSLEDQEARVWAMAQEVERFTVHHLSAGCHVPVESVRPMVKRWEREGRVVSEGLGQRRRKVFRLSGGAARVPRRPGLPDESMWRTARMLARFTPADLQMHSSVPGSEVSDEMAQRFCGLLLRGGYARCVRKAVPGRRPAMYHLVRDTGPTPPRERRVRAIWDANEGRYTHVPEPSR